VERDVLEAPVTFGGGKTFLPRVETRIWGCPLLWRRKNFFFGRLALSVAEKDVFGARAAFSVTNTEYRRIFLEYKFLNYFLCHPVK